MKGPTVRWAPFSCCGMRHSAHEVTNGCEVSYRTGSVGDGSSAAGSTALGRSFGGRGVCTCWSTSTSWLVHQCAQLCGFIVDDERCLPQSHPRLGIRASGPPLLGISLRSCARDWFHGKQRARPRTGQRCIARASSVQARGRPRVYRIRSASIGVHGATRPGYGTEQ